MKINLYNLFIFSLEVSIRIAANDKRFVSEDIELMSTEEFSKTI